MRWKLHSRFRGVCFVSFRFEEVVIFAAPFIENDLHALRIISRFLLQETFGQVNMEVRGFRNKKRPRLKCQQREFLLAGEKLFRRIAFAACRKPERPGLSSGLLDN